LLSYTGVRRTLNPPLQPDPHILKAKIYIDKKTGFS